MTCSTSKSIEDAGLLQCSANEIKLDGMLDLRDKDAIELVEDIDEESD